jgi:DNA-binding Lrp family transcriptional regulator
MDELDRRLLNTIQSDFPITSRPYAVLGEMLGVSEDDALARTKKLARSGVIRRIGPAFDTRKLGHTSTLVAAKVPPDRLAEVAEIVSSFPQVTHNYGRDHEFNLWFTLVCRNEAEMERVVNEIKARTGASDMHALPAERMFKLRVEFEF